MNMKRIYTILLFLLVFAVNTFADYPIFWQRYTADPSALVWNGRLYLFCSHDSYDKICGYGYYMNDVTCISTVDVKNWTDHGEVFSYKDSSWGATMTWAPQVLECDGKFYMYYGDGDKAIGVAVADNPLGPYKDERTTPLVSAETPGVMSYDSHGKVLKPEPNVPGALQGSENWGQWVFDPCAFIDHKTGKAYLYFGGGHPANSRIIRLKDNLVETEGNAVHPNTPGFFEASWVHSYCGNYYLSYSGHWFKKPAGIEYVMSTCPMYGYEKSGVMLPNPPDNDDNNNHHSVVEYRGKWYIAYHNRKVVHEQMKAANLGVQWCTEIDGVDDHRAHEYMRSVCIDELKYNDDGTIVTVTPTEDGLEQLECVNPYARQEAEMMSKGWGIDVIGGVVISRHESDYTRVRGVDFGSGEFDKIRANVKGRGKVEIRLDSIDGVRIAVINVSENNFKQVSTSCKRVTGIHDLYFVFRSKGSEIDYWIFE